MQSTFLGKLSKNTVFFQSTCGFRFVVPSFWLHYFLLAWVDESCIEFVAVSLVVGDISVGFGVATAQVSQMLGVWSPVWESGWGWLDGWAFKLLQIRGGSAQNTETWFQLSNYCALHFCDTQPTVQTRSLNFSTFRPTDVYSQKLSGVNLLYQMHSENCISCRKFHPLDWYALHIAYYAYYGYYAYYLYYAYHACYAVQCGLLPSPAPMSVALGISTWKAQQLFQITTTPLAGITFSCQRQAGILKSAISFAPPGALYVYH